MTPLQINKHQKKYYHSFTGKVKQIVKDPYRGVNLILELGKRTLSFNTNKEHLIMEINKLHEHDKVKAWFMIYSNESKTKPGSFFTMLVLCELRSENQQLQLRHEDSDYAKGTSIKPNAEF